jgi:hypothetical protein
MLLLVRVLIYSSPVHVFRSDLVIIHLIRFPSFKCSIFYQVKFVELLTVTLLIIKSSLFTEATIFFSQKTTFDSVSQTAITSLILIGSDHLFHP